MLDPLILTAVSIGFGLLFLLAAAHKLAGLGEFRRVMADYRLLPRWSLPVASVAFAVLEATTGAAWLVAANRTLVALTTIALLGAYAAAIAINLGRGRTHISCGCGFGKAAGDEGDLLSWALVLRNLVLAGVAGLAMLPTAPRDYGGLDYVTLSASLLAAVLLFAASNQLIRNRAVIRARRRPDRRND